MTTPRIESKWTRINEEWVQVHCEILRGPNGRYDRPAEHVRTHIAQVEKGASTK